MSVIPHLAALATAAPADGGFDLGQIWQQIMQNLGPIKDFIQQIIGMFGGH